MFPISSRTGQLDLEPGAPPLAFCARDACKTSQKYGLWASSARQTAASHDGRTSLYESFVKSVNGLSAWLPTGAERARKHVRL